MKVLSLHLYEDLDLSLREDPDGSSAFFGEDPDRSSLLFCPPLLREDPYGSSCRSGLGSLPRGEIPSL